MLIEKVSFHPAPQASKEVSGEVLYQIRDYLDSTLRKAITAEIPVVEQAQPGTVRVRMALTAASVEKGLKPYQLLPTALIVQGVKEAAGKRKHDVKLRVEADLTDSITGETLALIVRDAKGVDVKGKEKLTLADAKPQIDKWGEALREMIILKLKK